MKIRQKREIWAASSQKIWVSTLKQKFESPNSLQSAGWFISVSPVGLPRSADRERLNCDTALAPRPTRSKVKAVRADGLGLRWANTEVNLCEDAKPSRGRWAFRDSVSRRSKQPQDAWDARSQHQVCWICASHNQPACLLQSCVLWEKK